MGEASRSAMEEILDEIRSGAFAREWLLDADRAGSRLGDGLAASLAHPIERARESALGEGKGVGPAGPP